MLHYKDEFETQNAKIIRFNIGSFGVNTYIVICKRTLEAAVIDPGGENPAILERIKREGVRVTHLLFTHAHVDHMFGAQELKDAIPEAKVTYHAKERPVVEFIPKMCAMFGVPERPMPAQEMDLEQTPEFSVGCLQVRSLLTPGHTPGGVCYLIAEEKIAFTGDTLFKGSVGRTDFEGGSGIELRKSLDRIVEIFPDDVQILPGHGKYSNMAQEKATNFYFRVDYWR